MTKSATFPLLLALGAAGLGCSKEEAKPQPAASASASAAPAPSAPPSASAAPAPSATASGPPIECPKGSSGEGSFTKPCDAKGNARMMEVTWTGKTDDKGPSFRVVSKAPKTILYGRIAVYFYDKSGKQLDVPDPGGGKPRPYHICGGNMFGGVMKPAEKATITFSCVSKPNVPDGAAAIEAEMQWVGFASADEKKVEGYWRNQDLTPDARKKGGVK